MVVRPRRVPARVDRAAFTLVELMTVVVILGVLASIAIPAFVQYTLHARAGEASQELRVMFGTAASFYGKERAYQGTTGSTQTYCIVGSSPISPAIPGASKQRFVQDGTMAQLGFSIADSVYFGYGLESLAAAGTLTCSVAPGVDGIYTMLAHGDLDGDAIQSTYELNVGTDDSNNLYHSRGFYIINPIE